MSYYTKEDILHMIDEEDVKFIRLQFADFFGVLRNIAVTGAQIKKALDGSCSIDGFHIRGAKALGYRNIYLMPDLDTFAILPWRPQNGKVARFLCDLTDREGNLLPESPRTILRQQLKRAEEKGLYIELNPECEFFLFDTDENGLPTNQTTERAYYLDMAPLDSGENARRDIIFALENLGFEMESSHHEDAPAQHAVSFQKATGIRMADRILTLRNTVRTIAVRHGFYATFMPKPRADLPGSAMALNASCQDLTKDWFTDPNDAYGLSEDGKHFIAGLLAHMRGACAIANPIVNSYKRSISRFHDPKGIYWSPSDYRALVTVSKNENDRTVIEWELPDGATNPYLNIAYLLAAGLEGIEKKLPLPKPDCQGQALPETLIDAIKAFSEDDFFRQLYGDNYASVYISEKKAEWDSYAKEVTDWEIREYLGRI
ncbi:glutamine synthetase family protein [Lachnospiraceae bacterium YH-ros2226]